MCRYAQYIFNHGLRSFRREQFQKQVHHRIHGILQKPWVVLIFTAENIKAEWESTVSIEGIKQNDIAVVDSLLRKHTEYVAYQVTMGINYADTALIIDRLHDKLAQQGRFPDPAYADEI